MGLKATERFFKLFVDKKIQILKIQLSARYLIVSSVYEVNYQPIKGSHKIWWLFKMYDFNIINISKT